MSEESAYFIAECMDGKHDIKAIKRNLDSLHGVRSISVTQGGADGKSGLVCVDYDSSGVSYDAIENQLNKMGYQIAADASNIHTQ